MTDCVIMQKSMKFNFFKLNKRGARKTIADYKQEILLKQGRDQFKKLVEKGLGIPVALL